MPVTAIRKRDRVSSQALYQSISVISPDFCRNTSRSPTGATSIELAQKSCARHHGFRLDAGKDAHRISPHPDVGIEIGRANFRWEVTSLALSIARWVHSSTMA